MLSSPKELFALEQPVKAARLTAIFFLNGRPFCGLLDTGALIQTLKDNTLIVEWLHLAHTPKNTIVPKITQIAQLISKGRLRAKALIGLEPFQIFVPMPLHAWDQYMINSESLQGATEGWNGTVSCHAPSDFRFKLLAQLPLTFSTPCSLAPIPHALTVFADGGKSYGACAWMRDGVWITRTTGPQTSAQWAELAAAILAFTQFPHLPFNLILDSLYVTQIVKTVHGAYLSPATDPALMSLFLALQTLIADCKHPFFVAHIRSHQPFPGMLQEGNNCADAATAVKPIPQVLPLTALTPWESHAYFHQNKKALMKQFGLTTAEAIAILQQCPTCSKQATNLPIGVNPRGTQACQLWQMDVTRYDPFKPWSYLHVTVDTYSGFIMATPQRGETTKHVVNHCLKTFAVLGSPAEIKTDNGPAYTSSQLAIFLTKWNIRHQFGIPYKVGGRLCQKGLI